MKIAMWSGPRNLSTALMYSFGARDDMAVTDEPFYGPYLKGPGAHHPMQAQILAQVSSDPAEISTWLAGDPPEGQKHWYQKHMCHHVGPETDLDFAKTCCNVFLIRDPRRVAASFDAKLRNPSARDLGALDQIALFHRITDLTGQRPIIIDSSDIRKNPEQAMGRLCAAIGLDFERSMLSWPKGGHKNDGPWAAHWYGAVHQSTGFAGPEGPMPDLPSRLNQVAADAMPAYEALSTYKLAL